MRILYLCPSPYLGLRDRAGWSTHIHSVIQALREMGHEVYPFLAASNHCGLRGPEGTPDCGLGTKTGSADEGSPSLSANPQSGVPSGPRNPQWRRLTPAMLRLARRDVQEILHDHWLTPRVIQACRSFGAEVIYERTEVYHGAGARAARRLGLPLVLEVNGPLVDERLAWAGMLFPDYARRIEAGKYAAAAAIVTVSAALAEHLVGLGVDRPRLHPIPNGADTRLFSPETANGAALRAAFGLERRLVVGFVGAFADWHGLETLVAAMGTLCGGKAVQSSGCRAQGPDRDCLYGEPCTLNSEPDDALHLLMVGDGPMRADLQRLSQRCGLAERVTWPGSVPHEQVPQSVAAMDICVLPRANWYMSPIKLFEYGAMGKAVIAPRTPAVCEVIRDGKEGLLVRPGCPEELARAIRRLACQPELRGLLGERLRQRVCEHHTWQQVAGRVSRLLEQSVQSRSLAPAGERLAVSD